jgi:AcrR family transcriptional regulator
VPPPKVHDENLRARLLDHAGRILTERGPHALRLRTLAAKAGTSTSAVYSLFGGKAGLVRALYIEAFQRFQEHLRRVPVTDEPAEALVQLGLVYRASARADPHLYSIMFGRPIPDFEPDDEACAVAGAAFQTLLNTAQRCVAARTLAGPAERLALAAWATAHGLVSLEMAGTLPPGIDVAANYERVLRATVVGWRATE